jgi:hypothetical protein
MSEEEYLGCLEKGLLMLEDGSTNYEREYQSQSLIVALEYREALLVQMLKH